MQLTIKLSKLLRMIRAQADYEDSQFISDLELVDNLNLLRTELYTQVLDQCTPMKLRREVRVLLTPPTPITETQPTYSVAILPDDVYKIVGVYRGGFELVELHQSYSKSLDLSSGQTFYVSGDTLILGSIGNSTASYIDIRYYPTIEEVELPEVDANNEWITDPDVPLLCPEEVTFMRAGSVEYILTKDESDPTIIMRARIDAQNRIISTFKQAIVQPRRVVKAV